MITAVDTNVLLDVFTDDPEHARGSLAALRRCLVDGQVLACDVVWAEVTAAFGARGAANAALRGIPVDYSAVEEPAAARAGDAWRVYRAAGGSRARVVADLVVGAHALEQADRLLTRDRGFQRASFAGLDIVDPSRR
jgi:predicted nucleic acid-binding protein